MVAGAGVWRRFGQPACGDGTLALRGGQAGDAGDGEGWRGYVMAWSGRRTGYAVTSVTSVEAFEGEGRTARAGDAPPDGAASSVASSG